MRKIVAGLFISLDGVVRGARNWHFPYFNDEMGETVKSQLAAADTMLLGRRTYEEFAAYWPDQASDVPTGGRDQQHPKLVASTTLTTRRLAELDASSRATSRQHLARLKQEPGKDISITGSPTLVRSLLRDGVLDELRLFVHPIVVGSGKRLLEDGGERLPLKLADSRTFRRACST